MTLARFIRTVRHLRPGQISNRLARRLRRPAPSYGDAEPTRQPCSSPVPFIARPPNWDGASRFSLLNVERTIIGPACWNEGPDKLWLYHLHYFDDLTRVDAKEWQNAHRDLMRRWINENPPGHGNGWEPYPISLRVVNWIKWAIKYGPCDPWILNSLAIQLRHLASTIEYHLLGNHLWANAKALFLGGLFFKGPEADQWHRHGLRLLERELQEQILADGGHFERSPTYHAIILEDVLDILNISACYKNDMHTSWTDTARAMLVWMEGMCRPDGAMILWNDAAGGTHPTPHDVRCYARRLGAIAPPLNDWGCILPATGYACMAQKNAYLWFDAAPIGPDYIPGHGHADTLNIELFAHGQPIIIDTGVSTYMIGSRRSIERSTRAHNSVEIDGKNSSEVWAGFRVGRRARIRNVSLTPQRFYAEHDGYNYMGARHAREILRLANGFRLIDTVWRRRPGQQIAYFHFAPGLAPQIDGNSVQVGGIRLEFEGSHSLRVEKYQAAVGFNQLANGACLVIPFERELVTKVTL